MISPTVKWRFAVLIGLLRTKTDAAPNSAQITSNNYRLTFNGLSFHIGHYFLPSLQNHARRVCKYIFFVKNADYYAFQF